MVSSPARLQDPGTDEKPRRLFTWRRLRRHWLALAGAGIVSLVLLTAIFAPALAPRDPVEQDVIARLQPPGWTDDQGRAAVLGTDQLGRDILSRLIHGSRISLLVGLSSVAVAALAGLSLGLLAGFLGGPLDVVVMRLVDLQLAFPFILITLAIVALLGPTLSNIILVFTVTSWPVYARVVRASVLSVREREFVQAARALGNGNLGILVRHIAPNVISPLIVIASFDVARMIITESALGFLGLGVQPPTPTWGTMLADGRDYIRDAWWLAAFPGLAIMFTAAGINLLGDGLRDLLDPHTANH